MIETCSTCDALRAERDELLEQLAALSNLVELQSADLERYKKATEALTPNQPERVPANQLQLAFEEVLASIQDDAKRQALLAAVSNGNTDGDGNSDEEPTKTKKTRRSGGRRPLVLTDLPVEDVLIDPDEVVAADGEGFTMIGEETSERVAFRAAAYFRLRIVRRKWARVDEDLDAQSTLDAVCVAPNPESVWPYFMADPSAVAHGIVSKYADLLPLHRQEGISRRHGFVVPRSTACGWFGAAYGFLHRIADAMMDEATSNAFCIATDSTGAPVRAPRENWQVFVFIADQDHIVFRYTRSGTSAAVSSMLDGFGGHVLADAASIFDALFADGMLEVGCWAHQRRYFFNALGSDGQRAMQALAIIAKLFMIARVCDAIPMPERTEVRAARARPVLEQLESWIATNKRHADPRGPLAKAIGYYQNQRDALWRFLSDGRLPLHNNVSESNLRNLVLGRHNWKFFENETGLKYYTVFRSLIASCLLHGINPQTYLQDLLRLAPHWPVNRVIELAPKHWPTTIANLGKRHRDILVPPWERKWPAVEVIDVPSRAA